MGTQEIKSFYISVKVTFRVLEYGYEIKLGAILTSYVKHDIIYVKYPAVPVVRRIYETKR